MWAPPKKIRRRLRIVCLGMVIRHEFRVAARRLEAFFRSLNLPKYWHIYSSPSIYIAKNFAFFSIRLFLIYPSIHPYIYIYRQNNCKVEVFKMFSGWWCNVPIWKNDGVRQWEGWHPIYEMENKKKLKPPTSFFLNLQQRNGLRKASSLKKMDLSKASAESWKVNWSINLWPKSCFDMSWSISSDPASQWHPVPHPGSNPGRRAKGPIPIPCFLVGGWAQPLWKIWVRQLGWWNSQYMESHKQCSRPPTSFDPGSSFVTQAARTLSPQMSFPPIFQHFWPQNLRRVS